MRTLLFIVIQLLAVESAVCAPPVAAHVGDTPIAISAPAGFADPSGASPEMRTVAETLTPPDNRLLALFVPEADIKRAASGQSPELTRYFMVQTSRKAESAKVSARDFEQFRTTFTQQQHDAIKSANDDLQKNLDVASKELGRKFQDSELAIKAGEIKPLGMFDAGGSSFGMTALTNYSGMVDGKKNDVVLAMATTIALVKGKIVFLYAYSVYKSNDDVDWTIAQSRLWLSSISSLNQ